jgi:hypothetical protein
MLYIFHTRIALSYLRVGVVAPVAVVVEGIANIVVAGTVVVVPEKWENQLKHPISAGGEI